MLAVWALQSCSCSLFFLHSDVGHLATRKQYRTAAYSDHTSVVCIKQQKKGKQPGDHKSQNWDIWWLHQPGIQVRFSVADIDTKLYLQLRMSTMLECTLLNEWCNILRLATLLSVKHWWLMQFSGSTITKQSLQTHFFLLGCRHPFNILENQHVKKGYMEFSFKRVLFKTNIYTQIIYITMLPFKRGIDNEKLWK